MDSTRKTALILSFPVVTMVAFYLSTQVRPVLAIGVLATFLLMTVFALSREKFVTGAAVTIVASLFLLPDFSVAGFGIRLDDYVAMFIFLYLFIVLYRADTPPVANSIYAYVLYSLAITLVQMAFNHLSFIYLVFLIKEVQYFVYFGAFYALSLQANRFDLLKRILYWLSIATIIYGCFQLVTRSISGYYGIRIFSSYAAGPSGNVFLIIFAFMIYMFEKSLGAKHKLINGLLGIAAFGMVIATVSRASIMAAFAVAAIYLLISVARMRFTATRAIVMVYVLAATVPLGWIMFGGLTKSIINRLTRIDESANVRKEHWNYFLSFTDRYSMIFGKGKGFFQTITGNFTLAADSEYVRNLLEVGVIGSILWFAIIFSLIRFSFKHRKTHYQESLLITLLVCGFLVLGYTTEVFMVSIQASLLWIVLGLMVGKIRNQMP